jgi:YHS domain-containing protein
MVKGLKILIMFLFALSFVSADFGKGLIAAEKEKSAIQTICPVMGGKIDKNTFMDYKGTRVYFGGRMCLEEFKKNPEKYMKLLKDGEPKAEKSNDHHMNMH